MAAAYAMDGMCCASARWPALQWRQRRQQQRRRQAARWQASREEAPAAMEHDIDRRCVDASRHAACPGSSSSSSEGSAAGSSAPQPALPLPRRTLIFSVAAAAAAAAAPPPAFASTLPEAVDKAWEGLGGGPADLFFPDNFLGVWDIESVLSSVDTPLGPEFVPDMRVVQRAQKEDLNAVVRYQVAFLQNQRGEVVPDRSFNTASLMQTYTGTPLADMQRRIEWNPDDPNLLQFGLPGGMQVSTRVTRRLEEQPGPERLSTSEYFQQLIESPQREQPKVKASQCFTKYHWRSAEAAAGGAGGGVQIVATQVVSDYLTAYDDPMAMMQAQGRPVVVYTYRMTFRRPAASSSTGGGSS